MKKDKETINGIDKRHVAQIIRRNMVTRVGKNGKAYSRKNYKVHRDE